MVRRITIRSVAVLCAGLVMLSAFPSSSQPLDKRTAKGLSVQLGTGIIYGGNGLMVDYQVPLSGLFRMSPFIGIGGTVGGTDGSESKYYWLGYSAGLNLEIGKMHRILVSPHFFGSHNVHRNPSTAWINKKTIYGPSLMLGYKGTARFGLVWQIGVGAVYTPNPLSRSTAYSLNPHLDLGIGYKF
jgi:hypothetical protein